MTSNELMQIGHDFGFDTSELKGEIIALLECVAEHAEAKERTARIEAQQRLADMQELAAKAGLAHRMAVQRCVHAAVSDAVAAEREACAKACESSANGFGEETLWAAGYVQGILDVASGIRARGTP